ncbi:hypothetical protein CRYUN_Cryun25bG0066700 [Craigia yunnanensis]
MMMIMKQHLIFTLSFLLLFFLHCSRTLAQAPAQAPAPPGPTNVTKILEKAGQFSIFIRLMKATQVSNQMLGQLNNTNNGITIFAPTDNAFSSLKSGTLNSLTDEQQVELVQFHIVPTYLSSSQFQTVSNPVRTQAGDSGDGKFLSMSPLQETQPPAPAPAPAKSKKKKAAAVADSPSDDTPVDKSKAVSQITMKNVVLFGVSAIVIALSL